MSAPQRASRRAQARLLAAFAVVPFLAGALMFIVCLGVWYIGAPVFNDTPADPVDAAVALAAGVTILAVAATCLCAVPGVLWMARRGPLSLKKVLLLGAVVGNAPFAAIVVSTLVLQLVNGTLSFDVARLWGGLFGTVRAIALGLLIGPACGAVFWLIAIRGTEAERASRLF